MLQAPTGSGFGLRVVDTHKPHDLEQVLSVYRACEDFLALGPQPHASIEMVRTDLETARQVGSTFYAITLPSGEMAGILDFLPSGYTNNPRQAYLALIMIALHHRRAGLGRDLLRLMELNLHRRAIHTFAAHVQINNPASLAFFQSAGFVICSTPQLQPDGTTSVELRKKLLPG